MLVPHSRCHLVWYQDYDSLCWHWQYCCGVTLWCLVMQHFPRLTSDIAHMSPSLRTQGAVTTFSLWPWVWQQPGHRARSSGSGDAGECGRPGLASPCPPSPGSLALHLQCHNSVTIMTLEIVFLFLFYGSIVHLSQQLTHCLCIAHCLL